MENTINSKVLGTLEFDAEYDWYTVEYKSGESCFNVSISVDGVEPNELPDLLKKAEHLIESKYYEAALIEMETSMIALKNEAWLEDDEEEITTEEFRKRVTIESIVFYEDASSEIYCNDDEIFWGHCILIGANENGAFEEVTIAG